MAYNKYSIRPSESKYSFETVLTLQGSENTLTPQYVEEPQYVEWPQFAEGVNT